MKTLSGAHKPKWSLKMTLQLILVLFSLGGFVGCGEVEKEADDSKLTQTERDEKARKQEQLRRKQGARANNVLVELDNVSVVSSMGNRVSLRAQIKVNSLPYLVTFTTVVNGNLKEEFDLQDKSEVIRSRFPNHFLEVSSFRFKSGSFDTMGLDFRLTNQRESSSRCASQFALVILDPSLGSKALQKEEFEFPIKSQLESWSKRAKAQALDGEAQPQAFEVNLETNQTCVGSEKTTPAQAAPETATTEAAAGAGASEAKLGAATR